MLRYASATFLSAFLLFQVQPLIGKAILPWFGGTPAVWTTCLLFFQVLLLAGYGYAHLVATKLRQRHQVALHVAVVAAAALLLPIAPSVRWRPDGGASPTWCVLGLLSASVGLQYFALAATAPLLQAWFSRTHPGRSPYRLYALSNAGSLLALLSFPFLVEPSLSSREQAVAWSVAFAAVGALLVWCALRTWHVVPGGAPAASARRAESGVAEQPPGLARRLLWLALPACGSAMLLAATNQVCLDVAVVPFLWVLPLSLYLVSFILCFHSERWHFRPLWWLWLAAAMVAMTWLLRKGTGATIGQQIAGHSLGLFGCCMVCHGELVRLRPAPRHLTAFYLTVSAGGALGGVFVSLVAPLIFGGYWELRYGMMATCLLAMLAFWREQKPHLHWPKSWRARAGIPVYFVLPAVLLAFWPDRPFHVLGTPLTRELLVAVWCSATLAGAVVLLRRLRWRLWPPTWLPPLYLPAFASGLLLLGVDLYRDARSELAGLSSLTRNFYGVLYTFAQSGEDPLGELFVLAHGRIRHGAQFRAPERRRWPTTYYGENSGVGLLLRHHPRVGQGLRVGAIGLGAGTIATYATQGDAYRFYEINPAVLRVATTKFTFLADSAAEWRVVLGDGRLSLERDAPQGFDVLVLDAFNSDAVPAHLLTREAGEVYLRHMKRDGVIAVHISNRYLDLESVVRALADHWRLEWVRIDNPGDAARGVHYSNWMLLTREPEVLRDPAIQKAKKGLTDPTRQPILWTDDYSGLFRILK